MNHSSFDDNIDVTAGFDGNIAMTVGFVILSYPICRILSYLNR